MVSAGVRDLVLGHEDRNTVRRAETLGRSDVIVVGMGHQDGCHGVRTQSKRVRRRRQDVVVTRVPGVDQSAVVVPPDDPPVRVAAGDEVDFVTDVDEVIRPKDLPHSLPTPHDVAASGSMSNRRVGTATVCSFTRNTK
jgi:hypothetical protein